MERLKNQRFQQTNTNNQNDFRFNHNNDQPTSNAGQTLEPEIQTALEPKFGHSLDNIRIFSDSQAAALADQHSANALTTGTGIFFARDAYQPRTSEGLGLITHELTHALQNQQFGSSQSTHQSQSDDATEIEASSNASSVLAGGTANISSTPSATVARQARRQGQSGSGEMHIHETGRPPAPNSGELRIVGHEGNALVLNRVAFRDEVIRYIWGDGFTPTQAEFSGVGDVIPDPIMGELSLGSDHWTLAQTGFATRPELYSAMRPEVRALVEHNPNLSAGQLPERPAWVPTSVWQQFMSTSNDEIQRYSDTSPLETDIILIRLHGRVSGYAEVQELEEILYRQMNIEPPSSSLGGRTTEQERVHLTAQANAGFNAYMWREVNAGTDPMTARSNYPEDVKTTSLLAFSGAISLGNAGDLGAAMMQHYITEQ
jgi:Domain of unknown function (DUF4157)